MATVKSCQDVENVTEPPSRNDESSHDCTSLPESNATQIMQDSSPMKVKDVYLDAAKPSPEAAARSPAHVVPYSKLLSMADGFDMFLMICGSLGASVFGAIIPVVFILLGNTFSAGSDPAKGTKPLVKAGLLFFIVTPFLFVASWGQVLCWVYAAERQTSVLRKRFLKSALSQDVAYYDTDANRLGILGIINNEMNLVQDAIGDKVGHCVSNSSCFIASALVGVYFCWQLGLLLLFVTIPLIFFVKGTYNQQMVGFTAKSQAAYTDAAVVAEQTVSQIRTVYSYVGEKKAAFDFSKALEGAVRAGTQSSLAKGLGLGLSTAVFNCSWGLGIWYGGIQVHSGKSSGGHVIICLLSILYGGLALTFAAPDFVAFSKGKMAAYKIFEVIERKPTISTSANNEKLLVPKTVEGKVEFREVHFAYPSRPEAPIFKGLSLVIPAGKSIALVGGSGSGKSTVISLIERFYDPFKGEVMLDGHNIRNLDLKWLRSHIGLVGQEPALFATSIKENIMFGRSDASMEEVEASAKAANAHSFISQLPQKYETQVGERGTQMSGGQKQRLAIARAVLKNPAILLLDEATSALDAESEQIVQTALDDLMIGRTTVVVAHRLSTVRNADAIAVVKNGKIVERGSHTDLMDLGGAYYNLVRLQTGDKAEKMASPLPTVTSGSVGTHSWSRPMRHLRSPEAHIGVAFSPMGSPLDAHSSDTSASFAMDASTDGVYVEKVAPALAPHYIDAQAGSTMKRVLQLALPEWKGVVLGCLGSGGAGAVKPLLTFFMFTAVVEYFAPHDEILRRVNKWALLLVILSILGMLFQTLQHFFFGSVGNKLTKTVREQIFSVIVRNEVGWYDQDKNSSGTITGRLATDAAQVNALISHLLSDLLASGAAILVAVVLALATCWQVGLVCFAILPSFLLNGFYMMKAMGGLAGDSHKAHEKASQVAAEAVTNIRTVASFTAEDRLLDVLNKSLDEPLKGSLKQGFKQGALYGFSQSSIQFCNGVAIIAIALFIKHRIVTFMNSMRVFQVLTNTAFFLTEVLALVPAIFHCAHALSSIFSMIDYQTKIDPDGSDSKKPTEIVGHIEFKGVEFRYPSRPDVIVLDKFSLKIAAGKTMALVGPSGSGKSSTIALIERFYDPNGGRVLIDGKDIRSINLRWLRLRIALVQQEPALFSTTVRNNILYGNEAATEAEVIVAATAANAHTFISAMPRGYDTEVGNLGTQLSGGQKQRIAIARAVLKNPSILLLDEATSALDAQSEHVVQEALDRLMTGNRTTLLIAHRLSTIQNADVITVMQQGYIVEQGNHATLLASQGTYAQLVAKQQGHATDHTAST